MINTFRKVTLLVVAAIALSGCAHQRFTKNANEHLQQGRYELAIQEFEKALDLKPDNRENHANYQRAREYLDIWLDRVKRAADEAYATNQPGKAMLLYGKLADMRQDAESLARYQLLSAQLIEQNLLRVSLVVDPVVLGEDFGWDIPGLAVGPTTPDSETFSFALNGYRVKTFYEEKVVGQEYLSGTETVANPEFLELQDAIQYQREGVEKARHKFRRHYKRHHKLAYQRDQLKSSVSALTEELDQLASGSEKFNKKKTKLTDKQRELASLEERVVKSDAKLDKYDRRCRRAERELTVLYEQLSQVEPTVLQEVYATYHYDVGIQTQRVSAEMVYENGHRVEVLPIVYSHTDTEHPAHPIIDLPEKQAFLLSDTELRHRIYDKARHEAREVLVNAAESHRHSLLVAADQAASPSARFEQWVAYTLAGDRATNRDVEANIQRHLQVELGISGEFPVEKLIDLYGDRLALTK